MRRLAVLGLLLAGCSACSHAPPPPPPRPPAPEPLAELEAAHQADAAGDLASARAHLEAAVKANPSLGLAHVDLADVLLRLGEEGPELASELEAAKKLEPGNPRVWRTAGAYGEDTGDAQGAQLAYETALQLQPGDTHSRFRLAGLYATAKRPADAIAAYRAVLAAEPSYPGARLALAELLEGQGDLAGAETELAALTQAEPRNALYQQKLQALRVKLGKAEPDAPPKRKLRPLRKSKW